MRGLGSALLLSVIAVGCGDDGAVFEPSLSLYDPSLDPPAPRDLPKSFVDIEGFWRECDDRECGLLGGSLTWFAPGQRVYGVGRWAGGDQTCVTFFVGHYTTAPDGPNLLFYVEPAPNVGTAGASRLSFEDGGRRLVFDGPLGTFAAQRAPPPVVVRCARPRDDFVAPG